ncbi:MAG TPA: glutamine-hydrolyzing carbamoyl-phosphate synthase small subunit, partial [Terriglobia bacterium]|nr:glutamine-hydrolyzing carbamoyl-phosphate synthase small subunit [Terriglobia bacterium]
MVPTKRATLLLEDGRVFRGKGHGFEGEAVGEVVFNTSMTGYQEILTDPSYAGQIVTMTYPMIGNTGINPEDIESRKPFLEAFIVRRMSPIASNWRTTQTLEAYLIAHRIPVISDIDTRALVRHIRLQGSMRGIVSLIDHDEASLMRKVKSAPLMVGWDLASKVSIDKPYPSSKEGLTFTEFSSLEGAQPSDRHIVAYDFGIKTNILRDLVHLGGRVTVVPSKTPAEEVLNLKPDGIFLSNGPGDPEAVDYAIRNVRQLLGKKPIFGICLGHQIMG